MLCLVIFPPFVTSDMALMASCSLSWIPRPLRKEIDSEREEFAPKGSKFFPFTVDPFQKRQTNLDIVICLEMYLYSLKSRLSTF